MNLKRINRNILKDLLNIKKKYKEFDIDDTSDFINHMFDWDVNQSNILLNNAQNIYFINKIKREFVKLLNINKKLTILEKKFVFIFLLKYNK